MSLTGKAIVVTGAGRGIGAAAAALIAELGGRVVVNDLSEACVAATVAAIKEAGGDAAGCVADIRRADEAERIIATCEQSFGRVDGLVNNAGVIAFGRLDEGATGESLAHTFEVNVLGAFHCAQAVMKRFRAQDKGAIVNMISGAHVGIPGLGAYAASKGALASLTYTWAREMEGSGIRVNAVSPMAAGKMIDANQAYLDSRGEDRLLRGPAPEANAPAIAFLLSDRATGVHGQVLRIDGRRLSLMTRPAIRAPSLRAAGAIWAFEELADAFDAVLRERQTLPGLAWLDVADMGAAGTEAVKNAPY
jgi:NAD(P)-dependent dehydrogenase (short-subunit alcohol dehydrogenase family)